MVWIASVDCFKIPGEQNQDLKANIYLRFLTGFITSFSVNLNNAYIDLVVQVPGGRFWGIVCKKKILAFVPSIVWYKVWPSTLSADVGLYLLFNLLKDLTFCNH